MMVRITNNDAIGFGTEIVDVATGAPIRGVMSIDVSIHPADITRATIELGSVEIDVKAEADFRVRDPRTRDLRRVAKIIFADDAGPKEWTADEV